MCQNLFFSAYSEKRLKNDVPNSLSCKLCCKKIELEGVVKAAKKANKKTIFFCSGCDGQPQMCQNCYEEIHTQIEN